jgi:hypothetical protein
MSQLANNLESEIEILRAANEKMRTDCRDAGNAMAEMEDEFQRLLSPTNAEIRLAAGEMTAQELRTVRAVLNWLKAKSGAGF